MRSVWRGDEGFIGEVAYRLTGSPDLYQHDGRRPDASVNFITSHDGYTLNDLVSYNDKHNEANGDENRDGDNHNRSWNCGVEGPTDDPKIESLRRLQQRNFLTSMFLSQGVPMLLAGDEFGRTQKGNNNAYCQDNDISWVDWSLAETDAGSELATFVARLASLRRQYPILRCDKFLHGKDEPAPGIIDIAWFDEQGGIIAPEAWNDPQRRALVLRRAQPANGDVAILTCFFNPEAEDRVFKLPPPRLPTQV